MLGGYNTFGILSYFSNLALNYHKMFMQQQDSTRTMYFHILSQLARNGDNTLIVTCVAHTAVVYGWAAMQWYAVIIAARLLISYFSVMTVELSCR